MTSVGEVAQRADRQRVLGAEHALADLERAPEERLGARRSRRGPGGSRRAPRRSAPCRGGRRRARAPGSRARGAAAGSATSISRRKHRHARQIGQRARGLDVVGPEVPLAELDHRLRQRSQGQGGVGVEVVDELRVEPGCEAPSGRRGGDGRAPRPARGTPPASTSSRALHFGARAPEGTDALVAALALAPSARRRRSPGAAGDAGRRTRRVVDAGASRRTTNCLRSSSGSASTRFGVDRRQRLVPEHVADHRGVLQRACARARRARRGAPAARR